MKSLQSNEFKSVSGGCKCVCKVRNEHVGQWLKPYFLSQSLGYCPEEANCINPDHWSFKLKSMGDAVSLSECVKVCSSLKATMDSCN